MFHAILLLSMFAVHFYLPREKVPETPSVRDGVPPEVERNNLCFAIDCMQQTAQLMDLESVVFTRAAILFHRFYCRRSVQNHDVKNMIGPALALACKLEDAKPAGVGRDFSMLMRMTVTVVQPGFCSWSTHLLCGIVWDPKFLFVPCFNRNGT